MFAWPAAVQGETKQVLVLHSYRAGYEWTDELARGIRTTFAASGKYELWMEYLEARRIPYPQSASDFRAYIQKRHGGRKFDLILTTDDEALDFALHEGLKEWAALPIVFCGVELASLPYELPRDRVTGVLEHFPAEEFLAAALMQHDGRRHVVVAVDRSPLGRSIAEHYKRNESKFPDVSFEYLDGSVLSLTEMKARVASVRKDSILLISQFREDRDGNYVRAEDGEYALASAASVPVYGPSVSKVGNGFVGGTPNEGFHHGSLAAATALKVLQGTPVSALPVQSDRVPRFVYDAPALRRWGIPPRDVPEGAEILNQPVSLYSQYGRVVFAGVALASLQMAVIGMLIWTNLRRRAAEAKLQISLEERQKALEEASRASEMKSRFVANISHEIRTPMNGVLGMLHLLSATPLEKEQRECVGLAQSSGEALLAILNDILDFSRIEANRLELMASAFSLRQQLRGVCGLLLPAAKAKGLPLELSIEDGVPDSLRGDSGRLRQVLLNLVNNAVKFTDAGVVAVSVRVLASLGNQIQLRFSVKDSGIGIGAEQIHQLFQPFSQVDDSSTRRFGGTGLGLAISQQLAQLMGGRITVTSELGRGSEFQFDLPFEVLAGESGTSLPAALGGQSYASKTVMVVEDHPLNRTLAKRLLERYGCRVAVAEDGARALALLPEVKPDLVFMDVQMPGLSGLEVTHEIRNSSASWRSVPIVAMTASSMSGDRERCLEAGMDGYLSKPLDLMALEEALSRWLVEKP